MYSNRTNRSLTITRGESKFTGVNTLQHVLFQSYLKRDVLWLIGVFRHAGEQVQGVNETKTLYLQLT